MRIAIATDHAGYSLKATVIAAVQAQGHEAIDLGAFDTHSVDFPDYAERVGRALQRNEADRGILLCGSGVGVCIAANKMIGVRASVCHDTYSAHQGVEHDGMNVLCLGGKVVGEALATELVCAYLGATFQQEERFLRRLGKINALETGADA
ncbi:MAG: ribose 5-phosphate isomerase B [Caldilineaceae bacterium]